MVPRYLKFARTLTLVSLTLPVPVIAVDLVAGCTGGDDHGPEVGTRLAPDADASAPGLGVPVAPTTGVQPCVECGITIDSGADADASVDAQTDGGGPSRGTPELPPAWRRA